MKVCTFFGHRECYDLKREILYASIADLIHQGVDTFYVGNQGYFDGMVYSCLKSLRTVYPHIRISVVLAYLPTQTNEEKNLSDTIYPEIEGHPKYAIERRNRWMIETADCCLCYICHTWGGAYKFARQAKRKGLTVINLGDVKL